MSRLILFPFFWLLASCDISGATNTLEQVAQKPAIELTGRVVDQAGLLTDEAEKKLSEQLEILEATSGPQFVVVTTKSLDGRKIENFSLDLARAWRVGHADRDDGVILLVAPNERKVRIEVGYGLEGSLSDPFCAKVIRETMLPHFANNEMETGIVAGADRLMEKMRRVPTIEVNDNEKNSREAA